MVKHSDNYLSVFDHFVGLALKGLRLTASFDSHPEKNISSFCQALQEIQQNRFASQLHADTAAFHSQ